MSKPENLQEIILSLQGFWAERGCVILQPHDMEVGAGTFHPATALRVLSDKPWAAAYVQPCRRPTDGRNGDNPNRLQKYLQFQVIQKPIPEDFRESYLESLAMLGFDPKQQDIRFVEDDWESQTLGAAGLGWEVWCDGMEISQITYFQQLAGKDCFPAAGEITYGLERIAMHVLDVEDVFQIPYAPNLSYGDLFHQSEREYSRWNFDFADIAGLEAGFEAAETECLRILKAKDSKTGESLSMAHPAYDQCIKASHLANLLDARSVLDVTRRREYISRVRNLAAACAEAYLAANLGEQP